MAKMLNRASHALKDYLILMSSLTPMSAADRAVLLSRYQRGDQSALREMVESFLPKVILWVAPRRGEGRSFQELIAIGNSAVIATLKEFKGAPLQMEERVCQAVQDALDSALKLGL